MSRAACTRQESSHPGGTYHADHNNKASSARWIRGRARAAGVRPRAKRGQAAPDRHLAMVRRQRWGGYHGARQEIRGEGRGLAALARPRVHHRDDEQATRPDHGRRSAGLFATQGPRDCGLVEDRPDRRSRRPCRCRRLRKGCRAGPCKIAQAGRQVDRAAVADLQHQHAVSLQTRDGQGQGRQDPRHLG